MAETLSSCVKTKPKPFAAPPPTLGTAKTLSSCAKTTQNPKHVPHPLFIGVKRPLPIPTSLFPFCTPFPVINDRSLMSDVGHRVEGTKVAQVGRGGRSFVGKGKRQGRTVGNGGLFLDRKKSA